MPTQPFEPLLNRDMSKVLPKEIIDIASPVLQETVNYATNLYQRCQTSQEGSLDGAFPVLASYLHVIQMIDSIEVLISNGCGAPADLLLRSAFEGRLTIEFILERKSKNRATAWLVKNIIDQIDSFETLIPSNPKGKEFLETYEKDGLGQIGELPSLSNLPEMINKLKENLKRPEYIEIYSEYKRLNKKGIRNPEWYSLFDGPRNLKQLALHLHQGSIYQILYPSWSRMSHISDVSHLILPLEDGTSVLGPIRNPMHIVTIAATALTMILDTTRLMLKKYRADEITSFINWYGIEVQERHVALVNLEIGKLNWFHKTFVQK